MLAMKNSTSKTTDLLVTVLSDLAVVVDGMSPERLQDPTPCTAWDVEQLRDHVLGWLTPFAAGFVDPQGRAPSANIEGYRAPAGPAQEVRLAAELLAQAIRDGHVQGAALDVFEKEPPRRSVTEPPRGPSGSGKMPCRAISRSA